MAGQEEGRNEVGRVGEREKERGTGAVKQTTAEGRWRR